MYRLKLDLVSLTIQLYFYAMQFPHDCFTFYLFARKKILSRIR